MDLIENVSAIQYRRRACKVFGAKVIAPLIKSKKYRKGLTAFLDKAKGSTNFRNR